MFIDRDLTYNQRRELFRRREEARQLDTHSGDTSVTSFKKRIGRRSIWWQSTSCFSFGNDKFNLKIGLCNLNKLSNKINLISIFLFEQTLHIFGVAETWLLPSITDSFVDIFEYSIVRKDTSS